MDFNNPKVPRCLNFSGKEILHVLTASKGNEKIPPIRDEKNAEMVVDLTGKDS